MNKSIKPKWFAIEQRGGGIPMMPAILTLFRIITDKAFTKASGIQFHAFLLDLALGAEKTYVRKDQWDKFCNDCYQRVRKNPKFQEKLVKEFIKRVPKFLDFCRDIYESDLKKKTNKELWQLYEKYIRSYEDVYVWGESFAFGARFQLSDYLFDYLKSKK